MSDLREQLALSRAELGEVSNETEAVVDAAARKCAQLVRDQMQDYGIPLNEQTLGAAITAMAVAAHVSSGLVPNAVVPVLTVISVRLGDDLP